MTKLNPGYLPATKYVVGVRSETGKPQYWRRPKHWGPWEQATRLSWSDAETIRKQQGGAWIENVLRAE